MDVLNKLPTDIWINIFQQLDGKSLSAASQTCKDWHDFIFGSIEIVGNLTLKINSYDRNEKYFVERYGCNFRNVEIGTNRRDPLHLSFRQTGSIMESIENAENLSIDNVTFKFWHSPVYKIEFPRLKSMKLGRNLKDSKVFVTFKNVQLKELIFTESYVPLDESEFLEWFANQNQLKSLECFNNVANLVITKSSNPNLKLKKIEFDCRTLRLTEPLIRFFKSQDELEECEVKLNGPDRINNVTVKSLLDIKSLRKLKFPRGHSNIMMYSLNPDNSVETFINETNFGGWVEVLPNLKHYIRKETFSISGCLEKLATYCPMLEFAKIRCYNKLGVLESFDHESSIKFSYLKEMHLSNIFANDSSNFWKTLTSGSPMMEKLTLHYFKLTETSLNYMCTNWQRFQILTLGCGAYAKNLREILDRSEIFSSLTISPTTFSQFDFEETPYRVHVYQNAAEMWKKWHHFHLSILLGPRVLLDNICDFRS